MDCNELALYPLGGKKLKPCGFAFAAHMFIVLPVTFCLTLRTGSESDTERVGRQLAPHLRGGDIVYLVGPLGAGKTVLARGLIRALAGEEIEVPSPTFALIQQYETTPPVTHADLYRLEDPEEVMELGLDDAAEGGILIVEWPERGEGYLPGGALTVTAGEGDEGRFWTLSGQAHWAGRLTEKDFAE